MEDTQRNIAALVYARTASPRRAAKKAGVDLSVVKTWIQESDFQQIVIETRDVNIVRAITALQEALPVAVETLVRIMTGKQSVRAHRGRPRSDAKFSPFKESTPKDRDAEMKAAKTILEVAPKLLEVRDFIHRWRQLQEQLEQHGVKVDINANGPSSHRKDPDDTDEPIDAELVLPERAESSGGSKRTR